MQYHMRGKVIKYTGAAAWHFLVLPKKESADIKKKYGAKLRGWRSVPVVVTVGSITWKTSVFPDSKVGAYLLPLKAEVRKKAKIAAGQAVSFSLMIDVSKFVSA